MLAIYAGIFFLAYYIFTYLGFKEPPDQENKKK